METNDIIGFLEEISKLYEVQNEGWKSRAYKKSIISVRNYAGPLPKTAEDWTELPNIGKGIAEKITEFQKSGKSKKLKELRRDAPPQSTQEFTKIPGVGMKKTKNIYLKYKAKTLKALYVLYDRGQIEEDWLVRGMKIYRQRGDSPRIPLFKAHKLMHSTLEKLKELSFVRKVVPAGSIRRCRPTVKDMDVVVLVSNGTTIEEAVRKVCKKFHLEDGGDKKCYIPVGEGRFVDLYFTHAKNFGTMMLFLTGSGEWNAWMRGMVKRRGWKLNQYCLETNKGKEHYRNERGLVERIFGRYITPECREKPGDLGEGVVELGDIKGDFHVHTTKSDGKDTPMTMALESKYDFIGFADHVGHMPWAAPVDNYSAWVEKFRKGSNLASETRMLIGAEIDVSKKCKISAPTSLVKKLDFVIFASHQNPGQNLEERYCTVMRKHAGFKGVKILAHPINRNMTKGVCMEWGDTNWLKIFQTAKDTRTAIEINGSPDRMDLDAELVRVAKGIGCKFALASDAHSVSSILPTMLVAVSIARKAQLRKEDIINCTFEPRVSV